MVLLGVYNPASSIQSLLTFLFFACGAVTSAVVVSRLIGSGLERTCSSEGAERAVAGSGAGLGEVEET